MKNIFLLLTALFAVLTVAACSTTVTGPVTGNKYNLDVGCTDDMRTYREQREIVIDGKETELDCPAVE